ncbi:MAG: FCSD flavin-binding domain-containing protein [Thiotrichales bacterium]
MSTISRRSFLKLGGMTASLAWLGSTSAAKGEAKGARVVVVGGGFGGATAAKYLKWFDAGLDVTLVEPKTVFVTCPASNWVLGGLRRMDEITQSYTALKDRYGVRLVHDWAVSIDPEARTVTLKGGEKLSYDRLIVSPGIDFKTAAIEGYGAGTEAVMPHAWQAGAQTELLERQIKAMADGGTVIVAAPPDPFRCPPGPPERVSMIAHYLKRHKPKSKILLLDAKDAFSKQGLFEQGWARIYGYKTDNSLIEWIPKAADGTVLAVDPKAMTVSGEFDTHKGDVINLIPPQQAGKIARDAGLANESGWCPVDPRTWESTLHRFVHVIGDAAIQSPLPKSGYAANSEGKVCAAAIVALLNGREPVAEPRWMNTCYSLVSPDWGISVAGVYALQGGKIVSVEGSGGVSPIADESGRTAEAAYAQAWYTNIARDIFG